MDASDDQGAGERGRLFIRRYFKWLTIRWEESATMEASTHMIQVEIARRITRGNPGYD